MVAEVTVVVLLVVAGVAVVVLVAVSEVAVVVPVVVEEVAVSEVGVGTGGGIGGYYQVDDGGSLKRHAHH